MKRVVVYHDTALQLLQDRPHFQYQSTTLIICSTKTQFLEQLIPFLSAQQPAHAVASGESAEAVEIYENGRPHSLLDPTLQLISRSKAIKLAFCPTIDTLRAYLSTFTARHQAKSSPRASLLILDLILLHHGTSEFSVQGLMRSLASAVEAAARNHVDLEICECRDVHDRQNPGRGPRLWDAQVPLVSGSVRLRGEDVGWSGRMVPVKSIAGRWFEFEKERSRDEEVNEDEEMLL